MYWLPYDRIIVDKKKELNYLIGQLVDLDGDTYEVANIVEGREQVDYGLVKTN